MLEAKQIVDPRSPVQPGRDPSPLLIGAFVALVAIGGLMQAWPASLSIQALTERLRTRMTTEEQTTDRQSRRGSMVGLFTADDYPPDAADKNEQGTTRVQLRVDTDGRPEWCTIIVSSGSQSLDRATCRIFESRARFNPAKDSSGKLVTGFYSQSVTWRLAG